MSNRLNRNPEALSNIFYQTARTRKAFAALSEVVTHGWERRYCKATRLFGPPGIGKTHVLTYFEQIVCAKEGWKILTIEVAPNSNPRKFGEQVLSGLGDPCPEHGSEGDKLERAKEAVEAQEIDVIAVEEVHRLIDDRTDRVNHDVGNWMTGFLNMRVCPLILAGELSAERVLLGNDMLNQRTFPGCVLTRYDWGVDADRSEFRQTLHAIDGQLGLPKLSGLGGSEQAQKIYSFGEGLLRRSADLIASARRRARELDLVNITTEVLADVADDYLAVSPPKTPNPFRTDAVYDAKPVIASEMAVFMPGAAVNARRGSNKPE